MGDAHRSRPRKASGDRGCCVLRAIGECLRREILQVQALPEGRMEVARVPLIAESQVQGDEVRPEGRYFSVSDVTLTLRVSCRVHSSTDCVRDKFFCIVGPLYREAALVTVICRILLQRLLRLRELL